MERRTFLTTGAGAVATGLAGCTAERTEDSGTRTDGTETQGTTVGEVDEDQTLQVVTYDTFVDAPSDSPGVWLKEEFERRNDGVTLEWVVPDQPTNHYVQRHNDGAPIDAEVFLGIKPHDLLRADENTDGELYRATDESHLQHAADIGDEYRFDPHSRVIPTFTSFCSIVYDGRNAEAPTSFDALLDDQYAGRFAVSNPQEGNTGLFFLLWTIEAFGEDGYLDYWSALVENDARILDSWSEVYATFQGDEIPVVVSYSNDRVYAKRFGNDLDKHQVAFLNGQGYANLTGMARFASGEQDELAHAFMDFVLSPEAQAVIAERNVTGPVNTETELPEVYAEYAEEPPEIVHHGYDELKGNLSTWVDDWGREIAGSY